MILYVAGPMRGKKHYNFPAFDSVAKILRGAGYEVISPAEMDRVEGFNETKHRATKAFIEAAFKRDFAAIDRCDGVALLPDWHTSEGTMREVRYALNLGKPIRPVGIWHQDATMPQQETVCEEAERLVNGPRGTAYDHPAADYSRTVGAFNALTGLSLTVEQGIMFMLCVKLSRESYKHGRDNLVDVCGYAQCLDMVHSDRGE